ncbi:MAG: hypothetical protein IPF41_13120 [Flavobacteriales bacterium]|nr:hypothetical protein [Flavobacteriales bacterium]
MTLNDPDNVTRLKWGFYMKEGKWSSSWDNAVLVLDPDNPLYPYAIRFRMAPDKVGAWQFSLALKAPDTNTLANMQLPQQLSTGYSFVCTPPLEDNKGPLSVNHANGRTLKTATGRSISWPWAPTLAQSAARPPIRPIRMRSPIVSTSTRSEDLHDPTA